MIIPFVFNPVLTLNPTDVNVYRGQDVEIAVNVSDASGVIGYRVAIDLDPSKVTYIDGSATKEGTSTEIGWGPLVVNSASPELAIFTCASATGTLASGPTALLDGVHPRTPGSFVGLMAAEGARSFYLRYGFEERPNGRPGMQRWWPKADSLPDHA